MNDKDGQAEQASSPASPPDLNRLRWHCRRGMLELDMVLARFLEEKYVQLDARQQQEFESLLALEDQALWQCIRGEGTAGSVVEQMLRDCRGN